MARTKATSAPSIEQTIQNKIESLKAEIANLENELYTWEQTASSYESNKVTIENILSIHQAPDLSAPAPKKYKTKKSQ
jgi:hypothetical protein